MVLKKQGRKDGDEVQGIRKVAMKRRKKNGVRSNVQGKKEDLD